MQCNKNAKNSFKENSKAAYPLERRVERQSGVLSNSILVNIVQLRFASMNRQPKQMIVKPNSSQLVLTIKVPRTQNNQANYKLCSLTCFHQTINPSYSTSCIHSFGICSISIVDVFKCCFTSINVFAACFGKSIIFRKFSYKYW